LRFDQSDIPLIVEALHQISLAGPRTDRLRKLDDVLVKRLHPLALKIIGSQFGKIHELRDVALKRSDIQWECETWAHQNREKPCRTKGCDNVAIGIRHFCDPCRDAMAQVEREAML